MGTTRSSRGGGESSDEATAICEGCAVRKECLSAALAAGDITGGLGRPEQQRPAGAATGVGLVRQPGRSPTAVCSGLRTPLRHSVMSQIFWDT